MERHLLGWQSTIRRQRQPDSEALHLHRYSRAEEKAEERVRLVDGMHGIINLCWLPPCRSSQVVIPTSTCPGACQLTSHPNHECPFAEMAIARHLGLHVSWGALKLKEGAIPDIVAGALWGH